VPPVGRVVERPLVVPTAVAPVASEAGGSSWASRANRVDSVTPYG